MTKSPSPSVDEVALPLDCKMHAGSRYASDLDCYKCGLGEGQVCPEYQAFAEASIAAKKAAHQVSPDNDAAEALQIALNREGILFSLDRCARLACVVAASLVSPPKAGSGEPVTVINVDEWEPCSPSYLDRGGRCDAPRVWNEAEQNHWHPKLANHEARGDGVRVTEEQILAAIDGVVVEYGMSLVRLVDGEHTYRLTYPGSSPIDFVDNAEGDALDQLYAYVEETKRQKRLTAVRALLPPLGDGRAEIVEALKRAIDKHIDAAPVDGINAEGNYNLNVFNQQQSYVDGLKVARLAAIRSLSNPGGGLS